MEEGSPDDGAADHHPSKALPPPTVSKGKSCKGFLYYSSFYKANGRNPRCVGITRSLPQVPLHTVGESEMEADKEGRSLSDFKYACVGYSVFLDNKDSPNDKGENRAELPFCSGIELLADKRASTSNHAPAHVHNKEVNWDLQSEVGHAIVLDGGKPRHAWFRKIAAFTALDGAVRSQPRAHKPAHSTGDEFFTRFTRNAGLVASGVARNVNKAGIYIKDTLDDMMYPFRRRPK